MSKEVAGFSFGDATPEPIILSDAKQIEIITIEDDPHRAALEDDRKRFLPARTWAAVFFLGFTFWPVLCFSVLGIFPIISVIATDIQGSTLNATWMSSGWTLGATVAFCVGGRVSDIFGRRYVLLTGQLILIISYVIGATAYSLKQLIAAMVIGGFGSGTAFVMYTAIMEILPNRYRSMGFAWVEVNAVPMAIFGSLAGHALAQNATWRWIYILGAITGVISLVGTAIFYYPPPKPHAVAHIPKMQLLKELDYIGFFLYAGGLTVLLVGLYQGSNTKVWHQAGVIAPIVLGGVVFVGCFIWEFGDFPKRPLFPVYMFKKFREFTSLILCMFVAGICYFSMTSLVPQQLLHIYSTDPIKLGELQMAAGAGSVFGGVVLAALVHKIRHVQYQLVFAVGMQTLFLALNALDTPSDTGQTLVFQFLSLVPFAWIDVACYHTAGLHIPLKDLGIAFGCLGTFRYLGGAIGSTALNIILNDKASRKLPEYVAKAVLPLGLPKEQLAAFIKALAAGKPLSVKGVTPAMAAAGLEASREAWSSSFRVVYLVTIPFGIIATIGAAFVADPSMYFTQHVAVQLETDKSDEDPNLEIRQGDDLVRSG